ncbi:ABC transporter substrate-binding protein, partial [Dickeya dianthicola]|uniref:ABC transporter substrate-binding protein n=1 Tax=Dickeya dianthicola TaxID=204039 RepID=UPI00055462EE
YTGTIAFIVDKQQVKDIPHSWADLQKGNYVVTIGDVGTASQASSGVLATSFALGGNEKNLKPALDFFAKLAKEGRLGLTNPAIANIEKG